MKKENRINNHSIHLMLILLLILVVVIMSSLLIMLGRDVYKKINNDRDNNYNIRVSTLYITNKIRQADKSNSIKIKNIAGKQSLVINEEYDGLSYETWIYSYNNSLYEITVDEGSTFELSDGNKIMDIDKFDIGKVNNNLYKVTVNNKLNKSELLLCVYSD